MPFTRTDFQQLADVRIAEAAVLVTNGMWDGAYYLAGYAVECALKACIMAYVERTGVIFEDKKYSEKCWTHDVEVLLELAGLRILLDRDRTANPALETNWATAVDWDETRRYVRTPAAAARKLFAAITDPTHGVLPWIRTHW